MELVWYFVSCTAVHTVKICGICGEEMAGDRRKLWHIELCNLCFHNIIFLKWMNEWVNISIRRVIIKLAGPQLIKNSRHFAEPRRFISAFAIDRRLCQSWARSIQPRLSCLFNSQLVFSSTLHLGLPRVFYHERLPHKTLCILFLPMCATCPAHDLIPWCTVCWRLPTMKPVILQFHQNHVASTLMFQKSLFTTLCPNTLSVSFFARVVL